MGVVKLIRMQPAGTKSILRRTATFTASAWPTPCCVLFHLADAAVQMTAICMRPCTPGGRNFHETDQQRHQRQNLQHVAHLHSTRPPVQHNPWNGRLDSGPIRQAQHAAGRTVGPEDKETRENLRKNFKQSEFRAHRAQEAPDDVLALPRVGLVVQQRPHAQQQPVAGEAHDLRKALTLAIKSH